MSSILPYEARIGPASSDTRTVTPSSGFPCSSVIRRSMGKKHLNGSALTRLSKAAYWLQRLHRSPDDEPLFQRCRRWCAAHPANADALERMQTVWRAIGQLER